MEIRKVQLTGGSSYIVTLPKEWIKTANIKKNDPLGLLIQSDGTLLITSKITQKRTQRIVEFDLRKIAKHPYLLRSLIGAYIAGYTTIKVKSDDRISPPIRGIVRDFIQATVGQEVVEETDSSITIRDLLNPLEMPFISTIKRMHIIVKGMYQDAIASLESGNRKLAEDIVSRDNDVDRLHWLVARQYNMILRNVSLAEKMNITMGMSATYYHISRIIERIGDHVNRIAQNVLHLVDYTIDKKIVNHLKSASDLSLEILNQSIGSFFKKDIQISNETIEMVKKLESRCEQLNTLALQQKSVVAISIGYIVESIRRIGEYAEDISEHVINYLISENRK